MRGYRRFWVGTVAVALVLALGLTLSACGGDGGDSNGESKPPASSNGSSTDTGTTDPGGGTDGDTQDAQRLVEVKCSQCHSLDRVWAANKTRDQWVTTVDRMKRNGLVVTDEEYATIVDHLASLSE